MASVNRPNAPQSYRTPPALLAAIEARYGKVEFDAACTDENAVAELGFFYPEYDALAIDWNEALFNPRRHPQQEPPLVFDNPPFGQSGKFAAKHASYRGRSILLCQAAVDSRWFAEHVHGKAMVHPLTPRVPFLGEDGKPAFVDKRGKPLGINRPMMVAAYGFGVVGFSPWRWDR
jgi:phage N-6-adenine-methyltransferase